VIFINPGTRKYSPSSTRPSTSSGRLNAFMVFPLLDGRRQAAAWPRN
jgi:hypothetical protein